MMGRQGDMETRRRQNLLVSMSGLTRKCRLRMTVLLIGGTGLLGGGGGGGVYQDLVAKTSPTSATFIGCRCNLPSLMSGALSLCCLVPSGFSLLVEVDFAFPDSITATVEESLPSKNPAAVSVNASVPPNSHHRYFVVSTIRFPPDKESIELSLPPLRFR